MKKTFHFIFRKHLLIIMLMVCITTISSAQITEPRVMFTAAATGFNTGTFQLTLPDSTGYSEVEIQLNEMVEDSIIFSGVYVFDQSAGLPSGWTWARSGTRVTMGMGLLPEGNAWQGKVRVKPIGNGWGDWLVFLFN